MKNVTENKKGGARPGAGRPRGSGRYGEPTKVMRVPVSKVDAVRRFLQPDALDTINTVQPASTNPTSAPRPLFSSRVPAGFPCPAEDYQEPALDLNTHLIQHREATFFMRVQGHSMTGAGIHDGDLLVVDRALEPKDGDIVIAVLDGELTVKRLRLHGEGVTLQAENPDYDDIVLADLQELQVWGVVTSVIHSFR